MTTGRWILAAAILGSSMAFIDGTVINVALPVLQKSLGATVTDSQWIVDAYLLALASLILAGGALGDHGGRLRVFAIGVVVFTVASMWCGLSPNTRQLIAARTLQGIGGALLVPGSLAIIVAAFPAQTRGKAIGTWSAMTSLAIIAGPPLGGWLVQALSWRAIFFINVPLAVATLAIAWHLRSAPALPVDPRPIDWLGTLWITASLAGLTYALIEMPHRARWEVATGVAVIAFALFVFCEKRVSNPIVPPQLFRSRDFTAANALTFFLYMALSISTFFLPFDLIQLQHYSPAQAGAAFLPLMITMSGLSRWSGALADRIGARWLLIAGPLVVATGFALLALPGIGGTYWTTFFPPLLVLGVGMAATVAPLTTCVMTSIDDERHAGTASGINNAIARAAGLLAIALFGAMTIFVFTRDLDARLAGEPANVRAAVLQQRAKLAEAHTDDPRVRAAIDAAFLRAFRFDMMAAAALAAAAAATTLAISSRREAAI